MIPREAHEKNLRSLLAPIAALIDRADVSEIMINGPGAVYVERAGRIELTGYAFGGREALLCAVRGIAQWVGRDVGPETPILEGRLPDGSRIEAVLPPAAPDGPLLCIRRFSRASVQIDDLVARGELPSAAAALLRALVERRRNLIVAGGTGSGKTSLLQALSDCIPVDQRVVVMEDARELQLTHEHAVYLEAQPADARGRGAVSMRALLRATLRLRPDRVVVGEVRGAEALDLVQAMTTGHAGCLSTIHATTPRDALARLETLALMSELELPLPALRAQIASAVHAVVQTARCEDGTRRVVEIAQLEPHAEDYGLRALYRISEREGEGEGEREGEHATFSAATAAEVRHA